MLVVVLSPPDTRPDEASVLSELLRAGLARYHVRKPGWELARLEAWLGSLPEAWRPRLVVHGQPALARRLGLGGLHWKDDGDAPADPAGHRIPGSEIIYPVGGATFGPLLSRSCHTVTDLQGALGKYDSVFFGPVFPSISKKGHGPAPDLRTDDLARVLRHRTLPGSTAVLALGGITAERLAACRDLGFDGAAVLGAVWEDPNPAQAFARILAEAGRIERGRHAA